MSIRFGENLKSPTKTQESISLKEELLSEFWSGSLNKNIIEKAEKILGNKEGLMEIAGDLLNDELIVRQEKIKSEEQNLKKVKNDILLEINKKITFYIENNEEFANCRKIFSNAKNLEELFLIKEPLINIAKKIGIYDTRESPESLRRNESQKDRVLLEHPAEIFKFIIDPGYVKIEREKLHSINKKDGIYLPNDNDPDGGDAWEIKKTDKKETCTVIDTFGHGLSQSYSKLFIKKIISMLGDKNEDLLKVDKFLADIDDASGSQFQLNTTMARVEIEGDTLSAKISGDSGFLIYHPETNEVSVCGLNLDYPGVKNVDKNFIKAQPIGTGIHVPPSKFSVHLGKNDNVLVFTDSGLKDGKNKTRVIRALDNFINKGKTKPQKITGLVEEIKNIVRNCESENRDDVTVCKFK